MTVVVWACVALQRYFDDLRVGVPYAPLPYEVLPMSAKEASVHRQPAGGQKHAAGAGAGATPAKVREARNSRSRGSTTIAAAARPSTADASARRA